MKKCPKEIKYSPIGIIHSPHKDTKGMPIQPTGAKEIQGSVEINEKYAKMWENLYTNPALEIIKPTLIKSEIMIMQPYEFKSFLDAAQGSHYY